MEASTSTKIPTVAVTVATFDDETPIYRAQREGQPIGEFADFGEGDYCPRGNTPLRDATAQFIAHLDRLHGEHPDDTKIGLLLDESYSMSPNRAAVIAGVNEFVGGMRDVVPDPEAGGKVLAVIFTDGLENASREVSSSDLAAMVRERERSGWTFIYMGSNQDAWSVGRQTGFSGSARGQTVGYTSTPLGTTNALAAAASDAAAFVGDNKAYAAMRSTSSKRTVTEDGEETLSNLGGAHAPQPKAPVDPPKAQPFGDIDSALKQAKGEKEE